MLSLVLVPQAHSCNLWRLAQQAPSLEPRGVIVEAIFALFQEAYKSLKPGGYIESYEPSSRIESDDGTVFDESALSQWEKFFVEGGVS